MKQSLKTTMLGDSKGESCHIQGHRLAYQLRVKHCTLKLLTSILNPGRNRSKLRQGRRSKTRGRPASMLMGAWVKEGPGPRTTVPYKYCLATVRPLLAGLSTTQSLHATPGIISKIFD